MGVEFHITRAIHWADNEGASITAEEWLAYVARDPELLARPENGEFFVRWLGQSQYEEPWLAWFQGNIDTKWPDTALYQKMLRIAKALDANVQDDDGTVYRSPADWVFDPTAPRSSSIQSAASPTARTRSPWWKRLLGR
jgi:hypothetical protein